MAKKKRRHSTGPDGARSEAGTTTAPRGPSDPSTVKPSPASPGGPNRQARKEEARQRREALRRRVARRRLYRKGAWVLAFLVAAGGVGGYIVYQRGAVKKAIRAAGCDVTPNGELAVRTTPPYDPATQDQTHILADSEVPTPPALSTYPSVPPVSGPHLPPGQQVSSGAYETPPDVWGTIHSLEHGAVVIWYAPTAPATEVNEIKDFYSQAGEQDHVIVAPFEYPDQGEQGALPDGTMMALAAWHHVEYCDGLSLDAAKAFVDDYRAATPNAPGYQGDAPEAGAAI
jgi:hypothetical protein